MLVQEIFEWNEDRDNLEFNGHLEYEMMLEEVDEFVWALPKALKEKFGELTQEETDEKMPELIEFLESKEGRADVMAHRLDALADVVFVAIGGMCKITKNPSLVEDVFYAVLAANNLKSKEKNEEGKITKPEGFVGPESMIKKIALEVLDNGEEETL